MEENRMYYTVEKLENMGLTAEEAQLFIEAWGED